MSDDKLVCACFNIWETQLRKKLGEPDMTYDRLIEETHIGTKCTACLLDLDLIIDNSHNFRKAVLKEIGGYSGEDKGGIVTKADFTDSGFFINDGSISTTIRIANYSLLFKGVKQNSTHDYSIFFFDENGNKVAHRSGFIDHEETVQLEISDIAPETDRGWFLISLYPKEPGIFGSVRPQISLIADNWSASFHTQPHGMATKRGSRSGITVWKSDDHLDTSISVINGRPSKCHGQVSVTSLTTDETLHAAIDLPSAGSNIFDLDKLFPDLPGRALYFVHVQTDVETRKHVLAYHTDGSISVDHFPN